MVTRLPCKKGDERPAARTSAFFRRGDAATISLRGRPGCLHCGRTDANRVRTSPGSAPGKYEVPISHRYGQVKTLSGIRTWLSGGDFVSV